MSRRTMVLVKFFLLLVGFAMTRVAFEALIPLNSNLGIFWTVCMAVSGGYIFYCLQTQESPLPDLEPALVLAGGIIYALLSIPLALAVFLFILLPLPKVTAYSSDEFIGFE